MKRDFHSDTLQRQVFAISITAALSLTAAAPVSAATPAPEKIAVATSTATQPARQCLKDLSAFQEQMHKDGYWRGSSRYGYGYPMYGYDEGSDVPAMMKPDARGAATYWRARPGYEVRTLLSSAQILAQRGQQASCEEVLGQTRKIYDSYAASLRTGNVPQADAAAWRHAQLVAAEPVAERDASYRSDQLIGAEVLNLKGEELGSVEDLVLSPKTGKIAYLVIARGGLFGIDEKYVPVPWTDFRATTGAKTLVLDTTKADISAAPRVKEHRFSAAEDFDKESRQVDVYWAAKATK